MAVNINVPSQVKTYANLAAFPATGSLKTIYIAEDTNKTYRWTGSVYVEISATASTSWGGITGTLSNQTDLQNALNAKQDTLVSGTNIKTVNSTSLLGSGNLSVQDPITLTTTGSSGASTLVGATLNVPNYTLSGLGGVPTSRTLTINGVTQDLSADRTFTISTGITIGTTAITSGTVGRVLFEGTGNVVSESANLFWDNTNGRLGVGGTPAGYNLDVKGTGIYRGAALDIQNTTGDTALSFYPSAGNVGVIYSDILRFRRISDSTVFLQGFASGNVAIATTTDAGFKLDVNGTARVQGAFTTSAGIISNGTVRVTATTASPSGNALFFVYDGQEGTSFAYDYGTSTYRALAYNGSLVRFLTAGTERARFAITTGNFLINTTTDAGFKLDVNGTVRVQSTLDVNTGSGVAATGVNNPIVINSNYWANGDGLVIASKNTSDSSPKLTLRSNSAGSCSLQLYNNGSKSYIRQINTSGVGAQSVYLFQIDNRAAKLAVTNDDSTTDASFFGKAIWDGGAAATFRASSATQTANIFNVQNHDGTTTFLNVKPSGNVLINTTTDVASSKLTIESTTQGFLPPRMTTTQRNAIASPAAGLVVYDNTDNKHYGYNGTTWNAFY